MIQINPIEVLLWKIRHNEKDVNRIYDKLAPLMQLGANSTMLNFGMWDKKAKHPLEAQKRMCEYISDFGKFQSSKRLLDIGSGYCTPALLWKESLPHLNIICLNLNLGQLNQDLAKQRLDLVNATSTSIPVKNRFFDRVIALESAHHFKPLRKFFQETRRVISNDGNVLLAFPVTENQKFVSLKLGILNLTWTSQHYSKKFVESEAKNAGFNIQRIEEIGALVYEPLADYYLNNRSELKERLVESYSKRIEELIFHSIEKMKELSERKIIEYLMIRLTPI